MCGIAGYKAFTDLSQDILTKMLDIMHHRGPDDEGEYRHNLVALGNRRLSIIDLKTGKQPIQNEDGTVIVVLNGEIYNFKELRGDLEKRGHLFSSQTDTEVLVHLYEEKGLELVHDLNGMFAFVIYDKKNDLLFGARDRLGIKPFYYANSGAGFFFASEIKSLLASGKITRKVDWIGLDAYFTFRYIPGERTAFKEVHKLLPGQAFTVNAQDKVNVWRYWDIKIGSRETNLRDILEQFYDLLKDAVRLRLVSDVPLGVFLSGGMDSTTIVSLMAELGHSPIKSYSIGFGLDIDETSYAEESARFFGCEHASFIVPSDALDLLPKVIWHMDEPFGDPILIPIYLLSQKASREVKVVLTGEGADEGQMGYIHHEALAKGLNLGKHLPPVLLRLLSALIKRLPVWLLDKGFRYPNSMGNAGRERLGDLIEHLDDAGASYFRLVALFSEEDKEKLYGPIFKDGLKGGQAYRKGIAGSFYRAPSPMDAIYKYDFQHWLPDNILNKQDRMTMASSIEGRVPFLDHRVVEFLVALPLDFKIRKGSGKFLLKEIYKRYLMLSDQKPRKKRPFFMPLEGPFKPAFEQLMGHYLSGDLLKHDIFNTEEVEQLIHKASDSTLLNHKKIFAIMMFNIWQEVYQPTF